MKQQIKWDTIALFVIVMLMVGLTHSLLVYLDNSGKKLTQISSQFKACDEFSNYLKEGERYKLYDTVIDEIVVKNTLLSGLYSPTSKIYCVWNDTINQHNLTELHEYAHYIIDNGTCYEKGELISCRKHFCGG